MKNSEWETPPPNLSQPPLFPTPQVTPGRRSESINDDSSHQPRETTSGKSKCSPKMKVYILIGVLVVGSVSGIGSYFNPINMNKHEYS